jgi:uncharacterized protein YidB (DUF937 family)
MASSRLIALLGLLAVAGYQNRDKIGEMLGKVTTPPQPSRGQSGNEQSSSDGGGLLANLGGLFGGALGAGGIAGALGDLLGGFTKSGEGDLAESWVSTGRNRELNTTALEAALGHETIEQLRATTGLSKEELLTRLQTVLPTAVDKLTPEGRLPTEREMESWSRTPL